MPDQKPRDQEDRPWEELERIVEEGEPAEIEDFLDALPRGEIARVISRLPEEEQVKVFRRVDDAHAAEVVELIPEVQAAQIIERLEPGEAAGILHELPSNEQADLIAEIHPEEAQAILDELAPDEAASALELSRYASDVAGGLMVRELLAYSEDSTVGDVVDDLRANVEKYENYDVQYAYVVDEEGLLRGVLRLRDLVIRRADAPVRAIMIPRPLSVRDDAPIEELEDFFDSHHFVGAPVVDEGGKLVGVVRPADVEEALHERSESDYRKSQGIVGGEELRTFPVLLRARRRLAWLSVNVVLNIVAASVIAFFQETLASVIALAVFLPIISDMSGCSGNQAVAVSIRELTLGVIRPRDALRVWLKEIAVGWINGLALGLLVAAAAWAWKGNPYLGLVVGVAMATNTLVAVSIGGLVPLVLKRFRLDPALASGPILTTVTDMCGFFLLLGLATAMLEQLKA